jgi:GR25 family glycosyltransferase involved in LPS biosynthesis
MLVLEDDAELLPNFGLALAATKRLIARFGFMRLQTYGAARHVRTTPVETHGKFTVMHCPSFPFGAMAYALSPRVAEAFVAHSATLKAPVDAFIKKFWNHGQPLFALVPGSVHGGPLSSISTIQLREKQKLLPQLRLQRFFAKSTDVVRRARFNRRARRAKSGSPMP